LERRIVLLYTSFGTLTAKTLGEFIANKKFNLDAEKGK
jgi:hypothetical protein